MSLTAEEDGGAFDAEAAPAPGSRAGGSARLARAGQLGVTLLLVGLAVGLGLVVEQIIAAPNITLIFVLPVVVAATFFGWTASLVAAVAGVLAFDFFFTQPYYSLRISTPSDLWAAGLLLIIGAIVSTVAAESRRRAAESLRAAERAQALQELAHAVIDARPRREVVRAAADALQRIFRAPAVVLVEDAGVLAPAATAGGAQLTENALEAARGALADGMHPRGGTYPYDRSPFDFWPVTPLAGARLVLGVDFAHGRDDRPRNPEQFVDAVAAYLAAAPPS